MAKRRPGSGASPWANSEVERSRGSSWLYSTLIVYALPSGRFNLTQSHRGSTASSCKATCASGAACRSLRAWRYVLCGLGGMFVSCDPAPQKRRNTSKLLRKIAISTGDRSSAQANLQMPPTASPGVRGTQTELAPKSCFFDTPSTAAILRKMRPLVSWKKTSHLTPARTPLSSVLLEQHSVLLSLSSVLLSSVLPHPRCHAEHQRARDADQRPPMR